MTMDFLIVKDFDRFCDYIKKLKTNLSPKKEVLKKKEASHDIYLWFRGHE